MFTNTLDQRYGQSVPGAQAIRRRELVWRRVDADNLAASPSHPGADIGGAAADLEASFARKVVRQQLEIVFRQLPDTPVRIGAGPCAKATFGVARGEFLPGGTIAAHMLLRRVHWRASALMSSMRAANPYNVAATAATPGATCSY